MQAQLGDVSDCKGLTMLDQAIVSIRLDYAGRTEEALRFYSGAIGARVLFMMRYEDGPTGFDPRLSKKVLHATFHIGKTELFAGDSTLTSQATSQFAGFALTIRAADSAEAEQLFTGLVDGGTVIMALAKTHFATQYGVVQDRFGVTWNIMSV